jgi:hypothetical protein
MSKEVRRKRRLISITKGNLRNHHIYLTGHGSFFPAECFGESSKVRGEGHPIHLYVEGLSEWVVTDLALRTRNGTRRSIFRKRGWIGRFFKKNRLLEGDIVGIEKLSKYRYRVFPVPKAVQHEGAIAGTMARTGTGLPFPGQPTPAPVSAEGAGAGRRKQQGHTPAPQKNGNMNRLFPEDEEAHRWYRFVLSYPPQLVRDYLSRFGVRRGKCVLDPFCGTGTTLVECKKLRIASVGLEAHPMAVLASKVKTDWSVCPNDLRQEAAHIAQEVRDEIRNRRNPLRNLPEETSRLLLKGSISPRPLHKVLLLLERLEQRRAYACFDHMRLGLASALVSDIGNLHFGPEVGVRNPKEDADVVGSWLARVEDMACDLAAVGDRAQIPTHVHLHDARTVPPHLADQGIDAVITSPPYPNEKDYTRTTRLETVLLGFATNRKELRALKQGLLRSNTRNVYKGDDDDKWIDAHPGIRGIAEEIEERRKAMGKTSGFERLYGRVTMLYFGGMARHFAELRRALRPGARLAYVVGDQASYLRVLIRTGQLLAQIAQSLGYHVEGLDLFRTRLATATRTQLREEVLVLRWPG